MLILLALACSEPDPDAVGPRWDTAADLRPTTTDPETLTVIDTATQASGDSGGDPGLCLGDGDAEVRLGAGGLSAFRAYEDGDRVPLTVGPTGDLGLRLDLLSIGLDTTGDMNVILRVGLSGGGNVDPLQEEYLAKVLMQCPLPGPGWVQVFAALPDDLQGPAGRGELSGMGLDLALSIIDQHRDEATELLDVRVD